MKRKKQIIKRTFSIILAVSMLNTGILAYAEPRFDSGNEGTLLQNPAFEEVGTDTFEPGTSREEDFSSGEALDSPEFMDSPDMSEYFLDNENIRYIKGRPLTEEEKAEQLAPFEELVPLGEAPVVGSDLSRSTYALYPTVYDARKSGLITPAKNQNPFGICWSFGMASLLETSLLSQNKGMYDLSEEHLAYFFVNRENDPLDNTSGDINQHQSDYHEGGNDYLASIFLTTWSGMTTEADVPLPTDSTHTADYTAPLPPEKAYNAAAYLTDAVFSDYSIDRMKQMLTEDHSVAIMFRMVNNYYNPDTGGYCFPNKDKINHVVTIVGWDDTYSKENFPKACGVTTDGAWIAKNSWGTGWGEEGCFYISYEDKNISSLVSAKATDKPEYNNNYFYDGSSGLRTISLTTGQSLANIFEAKAGKGKPEVLGEVNVITYTDNSRYTVQVYTDIKDPANPAGGTAAYAAPIQVSQPLAGVKTIKLPEVLLMPGTKYSVVIKNTGGTAKFCCEADSGYDPWFTGYADVAFGQGFFGTTKDVWTDLKTKSATPRIKAHTRTLDNLGVSGLKAVSGEYDKIELTWKSCTGVDGYLLYRGEGGSAKKKIADIAPTAKSYTDTKLKTGVKYSYTIVPYVRAFGEVVKGQQAPAVTAVPALSKPVFRVRASEKGYNIVGWSAVPGATDYRIYRKTPSGSWKNIDTVNAKTLKYYDKKVSPCASYAYTVRAWRKTSEGSFLSKYTAGDVIKTAPAKQYVSSVRGGSLGILVSWKSQGNCDGYCVYRKTKTGSWKKIKTISSKTATSYLDKTTQKGVSYYYAVRAYVKEPYGYVYSRYSASPAVKRK